MSYYIDKRIGRIDWNQEDEKAKRSVTEITGSQDYPVKVDKETASQIKERYQELKEAD